MVHREPSQGKKGKPRGRPFVRGNKRGKIENAVLDASGRESGDEGGIIAPLGQSPIVEAMKQEFDKFEEETKQDLKELLNPPSPAQELTAQGAGGEYVEQPVKVANPIENTVIESIEFLRGKDTLKIVLLKRHNRMYRIQIFLNESEIRPNTYTGASSALAYWNLLKGSLKNEKSTRLE